MVINIYSDLHISLEQAKEIKKLWFYRRSRITYNIRKDWIWFLCNQNITEETYNAYSADDIYILLSKIWLIFKTVEYPWWYMTMIKDWDNRRSIEHKFINDTIWKRYWEILIEYIDKVKNSFTNW